MILRHDAGLGQEATGAPAPPAAGRWCARSRGWRRSRGSDADFFCGRDRIVSELVARLAEWPLVGILGPSGIGKSSLLRAGVLRRSEQARCRAARAGARCCCARGAPVRELERALGGAGWTGARRPRARGADRGRRGPARGGVHGVRGRGRARRFLERLVTAAGDHERRVVCCARCGRTSTGG